MTDTQTPRQTPEEVHHLEQQRRDNRDQARALGVEPYGQRTDGLVPLAEAFERYDADADATHQAHAKDDGFVDPRPVVRVAGRVMLHRDNGKLIWLNLRDHTRDAFQVAVSKRDCDAAGFALAKLTDLSDIVVAEGPLMKTRTGEVTLWASRLEAGSKSLVPPPEKHAGLTDAETRYRQRYVDMWANPESLRTLETRSRIVAGVRRLMDARGFIEVETPMLQTQAGGAAARPFLTHLNALGIDLSLRIAPELYLKRLLVGGFAKVYEINRNFRNEGVDRQHNPEFTMIEAYQAFGDVESMMELTEAIVRDAARIVAEAQGRADLVHPFADLRIDYAQPFARVTYADLYERTLGFPIDDEDATRAEAERRGLKTRNEDGTPLDHLWVVNELFEAVAEPTLDPARPTWVTQYPAPLSPLTRPNRADPRFADRSDLFVAGMEIGPHYTELNDPDVQAEKFREQLAGIDAEESTFRTFDADFVRALKVGMPPAGGMGLGIDRLVMLMTDQRSIRDVIPFPFMRPEQR